MNLSNLFAPPTLTKDVTAGAAGMRDAYLKHIEETAQKGLPTLSWEEFIKQQQQPQTPKLLFK